MHKQGVFTTDIHRQLPNRFKERQRLDIAYGTADFNQHHIMTFAARQHALFNRVGDVRDHLHGRAQIVATTLFAQDIRVDTAGGEVVATSHLGANEALVVT